MQLLDIISSMIDIKALLAQHQLHTKKSLGQNFLIDENILNKIVEGAELVATDRVVEVGAGLGVLSKEIAPNVAELLSIEIDDSLIKPWMKVMRGVKNAIIANQDVLDYTPEDKPYKLVANIPYYITSPILKHFLRNQKVRRPDMIVLLIQEEVAQRICSKSKPTLLSWEIRVFGEPDIVCSVPPESFHPSPKVNSAVLRIRMYDKPLLVEADIDAFFKLLAVAYKQPRKTLLNNFVAAGGWQREEIQDKLDLIGIDPGLRPHQLDFEMWTKLFTSLKDS